MHEVRKLAVTVGDGESNVAEIEHAFDTKDALVQVFAVDTYETIAMVTITVAMNKVRVEHKWIDMDAYGNPVIHTAPIPKDGWRVVIFA